MGQTNDSTEKPAFTHISAMFYLHFTGRRKRRKILLANAKKLSFPSLTLSYIRKNHICLQSSFKPVDCDELKPVGQKPDTHSPF